MSLQTGGPAKLCAQIFNPVWQIAVCTPRIATVKIVILQVAKVRSLNLSADCHRPALSAWFPLGLRVGFGNQQCLGKLFARKLILLWQSAELKCRSQQQSEI
jgi:hypothetical protein